MFWCWIANLMDVSRECNFWKEPHWNYSTGDGLHLNAPQWDWRKWTRFNGNRP